MCKVASEHSVDTVWFMKNIGEFESTADVTDVYGHKVISGQKYMLGHFLEKVNGNISSKKYKLIENQTTIFFHESIVCFFVNFRISKSSFEISSKDFFDILNYVEHFCLTLL